MRWLTTMKISFSTLCESMDSVGRIQGSARLLMLSFSTLCESMDSVGHAERLYRGSARVSVLSASRWIV